MTERPLVVDVPPSSESGQRFVFDQKPADGRVSEPVRSHRGSAFHQTHLSALRSRPPKPRSGGASSAPAAQVVVTIYERQHALYQRVQGTYDIVHAARVPIVKALCGTILTLKALDGAVPASGGAAAPAPAGWRERAGPERARRPGAGRTPSVPVPEIITGANQKIMEGLGLPRGDGSYGDLIIQFDIIFPKAFSDTQKTLLKAAFYLPDHRSKEQNVRAWGPGPGGGWARARGSGLGWGQAPGSKRCPAAAAEKGADGLRACPCRRR